MKPPAPSTESSWTKLVRRFERLIVMILMVLLMVVISISTVELGWLLVTDLLSTQVLILDVEEMFELFGFFLLVLIGVELLSTLKVYVYEGLVQVEVVLEVALIAVAQKIVIMDTSQAGGFGLLGLAGLVLALAAAFWWVRSSRRSGFARAPRVRPQVTAEPRDGSSRTAAGERFAPPRQ